MKIVLFVLMLGCLTTCQTTQQKKPHALLNFLNCTNEQQLFAAADSLPQIVLDGQKDIGAFLKQTEKDLQLDFCNKVELLGIKLGNDIAIKSTLAYSCAGVSLCDPVPPQAHLLFKKQGQLFVSGQLQPLASLSAKIKQVLENRHKNRADAISLRWQAGVTKKQLSETMAAVVKGYVLVYRKLAQQHFKKSLCDLQPHQLKQLIKMLPFEFYLDAITPLNTPPPIISPMPDSIPEIEIDSLDEEIELNIEVDSLGKEQASRDKSRVTPCLSSN
jgi:hypothetical protein